jgi:DNA invertase Pin-like site-specific DNA recombinase
MDEQKKQPVIRRITRFNTEIFKKKRVAIYARISTARSKQTNSVDSQVGYLLDTVNQTIDQVLAGIYVDVGSGRNAETRKELKRLIEDCKNGKIDMVITKSVSRFGRNTANTLSICRELTGYNVDVYFHNENIHSLSPDGELTMTLVAAISEAESQDKSESVKWGIEKKAQDPEASFYNRPCYGYRKGMDGKLLVEEKEAEIVRLIFQAYLDGMSVLGIQRLLHEKGICTPSGSEVWPKRTIEKILSNEKYNGDVVFYKTFTAEFPSEKRIQNTGQHKLLRVNEHHQAIVSHEIFDAVQTAISMRRRKKNVE